MDSVWFPGAQVAALCAGLAGQSFTAQNSGSIPPDAPDDTPIECWGTLKHIRPHFGIRFPLWRTHSYCLYFEQSPDAHRLFEAARLVHDKLLSHKIKHTVWQNTIPDELCFAIATGITGIAYHTPDFAPVYAFQASTAPPRYQLYADYYAGTQPGNRSPAVWRKLYNDLIDHYHHQYQHPLPTYWKDKASF